MDKRAFEIAKQRDVVSMYIASNYSVAVQTRKHLDMMNDIWVLENEDAFMKHIAKCAGTECMISKESREINSFIEYQPTFLAPSSGVSLNEVENQCVLLAGIGSINVLRGDEAIHGHVSPSSSSSLSTEADDKHLVLRKGDSCIFL